MTWYRYDDADERKERLRRDLAKRARSGERLEPLALPGGRGKLCTTFWGQAWCRHLEAYADYEYRLPRGRSYLRQGNVFNLEIEPGQLAARVAGQSLYETRIHIAPLAAKRWRAIVGQCSGRVGSLLDLLAGRLGEETLRVLVDPAGGLFPGPREIRFNCNCPDWADLCKHCAAVLYGFGVLLDERPELLFKLRGVDGAELLGEAGREAAATLAADAGPGELADADLSALFGIDLDGEDGPPALAEDPPAPARKPRKIAKKAPKKAARKVAKKAAKKTAKKAAGRSKRATR
jgi:uncharacterized Zn finger protein